MEVEQKLQPNQERSVPLQKDARIKGRMDTQAASGEMDWKLQKIST